MENFAKCSICQRKTTKQKKLREEGEEQEIKLETRFCFYKNVRSKENHFLWAFGTMWPTNSKAMIT